MYINEKFCQKYISMLLPQKSIIDQSQSEDSVSKEDNSWAAFYEDSYRIANL